MVFFGTQTKLNWIDIKSLRFSNKKPSVHISHSSAPVVHRRTSAKPYHSLSLSLISYFQQHHSPFPIYLRRLDKP